MRPKSGPILFFLTAILGSFVFLTGCEKERLSPIDTENTSSFAARLKANSTGVPPKDTIRKDTTIIVLPPDSSYIPSDTIRKDTLKRKPKPFPIDSIIAKPPKDSIRTDSVKKH